MIKHCYIHIPFCNHICSYCDFCKLYYNKELVSKYLKALEQEISSIYDNSELETIYIGGGTPSSLSLEELEELLTILSKLKKAKNVEYTIEGNFESTTPEKLKLYKKYGINRLSFGLETIDEDNLRLIERNCSKDQVQKTIQIAKSLGFHNINVDLMYALPNESMATLKKDLDFLIELNIEHISTYSLIIEEHTKLGIQKTENISEDLDSDMYEFICQKLKENNYEHYEISNFCKKEMESKHNLSYWDNAEYFGFGLGASSYLQKQRITNTRSINNYIQGNYRKEIEMVTEKEKIEYEVILAFRKKEGLDLELFQKKYHKSLQDVYDYSKLLNEELLMKEGNNLFIPENKWYISNEILIEILEGEKNG